jgi:2-amino-4-hydroxy-6-hydroxymethyldihydropteridine diphosphokinase
VSRAVLSLGSNLGDRLANLTAALRLLADAGVRPVSVSAVYETAAVGGPEQPDYLNAVTIAETQLSPYDVLDAVHAVEEALGRERLERWGPRTVDVDIVAFDGFVSGDERLTLPHPRAAERAFVLAPWLDVDPGAALPDGRSVAVLLAAIGTGGVRRREDLGIDVPA